MNKPLFSLLFVVFAALVTSCKDENANLKDGLYAEIETSKGKILVELDYKKTPITVANFITLAEGTNTFANESCKGKKLYDGLKFHRVISKANGDQQDFMIQGGDPLGNGSGDAGYKFKDEITDLKFDNGGLLAMANSGPGTNGSQFFITIVPTPWLDGKHTIFGHVVDKGMAVVNTIKQEDVINAVTIIRKGEDAKKFDAVKVFSDYFKVEFEKQQKDNAALQKVTTEKLTFLAKEKASSTKLASGLQYKIISKGSGKKPTGNTLLVHYSGFLENGVMFDTSEIEVAKLFGKYDAQREQQNGYQCIPYQQVVNGSMISGFKEGVLQLNVGDKALLFIPSNLAYGPNGAGNVIPPNANIIFEVELSEK